MIGSQIPFAFDSIAMGIYGAICASATLILIPDVLFRFPEKLIGYVNENGITTLHFVPTIMKMVANSGILSNANLPNLKQVLFGREVMPNKHLNVWRHSLPDVEYVKFYGPTEASVLHPISSYHYQSGALSNQLTCFKNRDTVRITVHTLP